MNAEPFNLVPDPKFIELLSQQLPHKHIISRRLPSGNIQEDIMPALNFMEDVLRVHQRPVDPLDTISAYWFAVERSMWTQPYVEEVSKFLKTNNLNPDLLANVWLLRCRIYFMLNAAGYEERNRQTYDSSKIKDINFIKNKILPFMKQIQGEILISAKRGNMHSVSFKSNKPGVKTLKVEGHLADNIYTALQQMAYSYLKANEGFNPDLLTNRFKTAIGEAVRGAYQILRQWETFSPSKKKTPPIDQLTVLKHLIELAANKEEMLDNVYENSKPEEQLRKFFK
ncbi:hypothetical protein A6C57_18630 [Fibrella sp. ES10-3-2-2]|nr:hypothetical protein A6C57_18630 [Fibrella sp. ES10-3-2-2]